MLEKTPIDLLPRTSPITIKRFKSKGINTYADLLTYFPFLYEPLSIISDITRLQEGETVSVKGTIEEMTNQYTRRGLTIQKGILKDQTGTVEISWFNQPYLVRTLVKGLHVSLAGKVERFGNKIVLKPIEYEILRTQTDDTIHTGRLVPVYSQLYGLSSKTIREKIYYIIHHILPDEDEEYLPEKLLNQFSLRSENESLKEIHFPASQQLLDKARTRIGFDELFVKVLSSRLVKEEWKKEQTTAPLHLTKMIQKKVTQFISQLPFKLTAAQTRTTDEVLADIRKTTPMNRFVQGDVGSGKTVVAAIAAYVSYLNRFQTLIMAPTEILANQHYQTISKMFAGSPLKVALQTRTNKSFTKKKNDSDQYDIIIGTQALLTEHVKFEKVGLVVIDEQHRFGVRQRAMLKQKGFNPHLLTMTATPIPRTVSLTLYSELDLSVIDELPKGRLPIKTYVAPVAKRNDGYEWIKKKIKKDHEQIYIICPLIEESESETMQTVRAATKEYEYLKKDVFKEYRVALLHGKMKGAEKDEIMEKFKEKKYDILVSTSVVEVGIDVPNATVMIIEGAERFGLAQLHQLRGRVGRSDKQSYCFLFTSTKEAQFQKKLQFFAKTNSGMKLAEYDLKLRGPGQVFGTVQHGYDDLQIADITDATLVHTVQQAVGSFVQQYQVSSYPRLKAMMDAYQIEQISRD
jgi:ATP-dependent DNA helicase RecG